MRVRRRGETRPAEGLLEAARGAERAQRTQRLAAAPPTHIIVVVVAAARARRRAHAAAAADAALERGLEVTAARAQRADLVCEVVVLSLGRLRAHEQSLHLSAELVGAPLGGAHPADGVRLGRAAALALRAPPAIAAAERAPRALELRVRARDHDPSQRLDVARALLRAQRVELGALRAHDVGGRRAVDLRDHHVVEELGLAREEHATDQRGRDMAHNAAR